MAGLGWVGWVGILKQSDKLPMDLPSVINYHRGKGLGLGISVTYMEPSYRGENSPASTSTAHIFIQCLTTFLVIHRIVIFSFNVLQDLLFPQICAA